MRVKIAPSIVSADFSQLIEETKRVEEAGADLLHIDVYPLVAWGLVYPTLRNFTPGALIIEVLTSICTFYIDRTLRKSLREEV